MKETRRLMLVLAFVSQLAACNSSAVTLAPTAAPAPTTAAPQMPTSIAAATETTAAPTAAATSAAAPTAVPASPAAAGECGDIRMLGLNPPRDKSAQLAEDCFFQAFQQCRAAVFSVTMSGVDAGTINRFTLEKSGDQCRIADSVVRYVLPRPTQVPQASTCAGLVRQDGGLLFKGCGDQGDILVPAP